MSLGSSDERDIYTIVVVIRRTLSHSVNVNRKPRIVLNERNEFWSTTHSSTVRLHGKDEIRMNNTGG